MSNEFGKIKKALSDTENIVLLVPRNGLDDNYINYLDDGICVSCGALVEEKRRKYCNFCRTDRRRDRISRRIGEGFRIMRMDGNQW